MEIIERRVRRLRNIGLSAGVGIAGRLLAMLGMFITYPITLKYLGPERFALWMIVSSFNMAVSFSDLGLGNGLLSVVADASGRDDNLIIKKSITSAYIILSLIAVVILLFFLTTAFDSFWLNALAISQSGAASEVPYALIAFSVCFTLNVPLSLVSKIQIGLQQGYAASLWAALGSLLSFLLVIFAVYVKSSVPVLILAFMGGGVFANLVNTIVFFIKNNAIRPGIRFYELSVAKLLAKTGGMFFLLQLVISISLGYDAVIIAHTLGADVVPQWAIPERLFSVIGILSAFALAPLWPAYREAIARNDGAWARRIFQKSVLLTLGGAGAVALAVTVAAPFAIPLWVGSSVQTSLWTAAAFGLWRLTDAMYNCLTTFLNGLGRLKVQLVVTTLVSFIMLCLKVTLTPILGVAGIPLGAALAVGLIGIPMLTYMLKDNLGMKAKHSHSQPELF